MLFRPNLDCEISKIESRNVYGEEVMSAPVKTRCAIIKMNITNVQTTVRADSSASRGAARETIGMAVLLFPVGTDVNLDYQIAVSGYKLRVTGMFPRHDLRGKLDHYEVTAAIWGKE